MPFPSRGDLLFPSLFYNHPIAYRMTDRGQKREWNNSGGRFCAKGLSLFVAAEALTFFWLCRAAVLSSPRKRRQGEGSAKDRRSHTQPAPSLGGTGGGNAAILRCYKPLRRLRQPCGGRIPAKNGPIPRPDQVNRI